MKKILSLLILTFALFFQNAYCQLFGWNYYSPVTIVETSGSPQFNVEVAITINTATYVNASQMSSTGSDIRFGNDQYGDKLYPYWIASGMNSASTTFYIKLDSLLGYQCKTIYMFYGNSGAVAVSSLDSVFAGPYSATNYTTGNGSNTTGAPPSVLGYTFNVNQSVIVTRLGLSRSATSGYYCTLFNSSHTVIAQQQINGSGANVYATLSSPVVLPTGSYMITEYSSGGAYEYANSTTLNTGLTWQATWGQNNAQISTYPYTSQSSQLKGIPDMIYYIPTNPTTSVTSFVGSSNLALSLPAAVTDCQGHAISIGDTATGAAGTVSYIWSPTTGLSNAHIAQTQATPAATQSYTLIARDASTGCTTSAIVAVHVVDPVSATVTDSVCSGQSYYIGTHSHSAAGTYTDTIASAEGCDSVVTLHLSIHQMATPVITQSGDMLSTGAYTAYQWLLNNNPLSGATTGSYSAATSGSYRVIGTDATGCSDTSAAYAFSTVGINTISGGADINVYPNPGTGHFYISANAAYAGTTYTVVDELGRKIAEGHFTAAVAELDMSDVPTGVYTLCFAEGSKRLLVIR